MNRNTTITSIVIIIAAMSLVFIIGGNHSLTGLFVFEEIVPEGFEFEPPEELSKELASQAIVNAQEEIAEMKQYNFTTTFVDDVLNEANLQFEQGNYTEVIKMVQLITFIKKEKVEFLDKVELTERKALNYKEEGIDTAESQALVGQAMEAFAQDQLIDSEELLEQSNSQLDLAKAEHERKSSLIYLGKSFFLKYWWQILLVIVIIGVISPPITKKIIKNKRKQKLAGLKAELDKTHELIKRLQKSCFVDKKMTTKAYKEKVKKYEERIAEIKHTIPVIEAQLKGKKAPPKKEKPKGILEVKR